MTEQKPGSELRGSLAGTREPATDRHSDSPDPADADTGAPESDLHDISKILLGAQASTGKAPFSASRMTVNEDVQHHALRDQQKREEEREARELANLARWNTQMTTVGGVQMTNAQAQIARQNVIDNADAYAEWALRKSLISEDEKDEFKASVQRKKELEDKRGRGTMTSAEADEESRLDRSRVGQAIDEATAQNHLDKGNVPRMEAPTANESLRPAVPISSNERDLFQSAPPLGKAFQAASTGTDSAKVAPPSVAPAVKATGLDL